MTMLLDELILLPFQHELLSTLRARTTYTRRCYRVCDFIILQWVNKRKRKLHCYFIFYLFSIGESLTSKKPNFKRGKQTKKTIIFCVPHFFPWKQNRPNPTLAPPFPQILEVHFPLMYFYILKDHTFILLCLYFY